MRALVAGMGLAIVIVIATNQVRIPFRSGGSAALAKSDAERPSELIGKPAPEFEGLIGVDDRPHSLKDYADAKAVVVAFICNHCPVAVAYEDRLIALEKEYGEKGVQVIAINVNNTEADKLPAMKERAKEKEFPFPYLYDPTQKVGRDYGASVTPHIFLLDSERKFAFIGPVDDNMQAGKVTETYLRDAVDAVLAGKKPPTTEVKPFGCGIKYE
jgi:thiol-disulfide isomerase/thioredoxin